MLQETIRSSVRVYGTVGFSVQFLVLLYVLFTPNINFTGDTSMKRGIVSYTRPPLTSNYNCTCLAYGTANK